MPVTKQDVVPAPLILEDYTDQRRARAFGTARTQLVAIAKKGLELIQGDGLRDALLHRLRPTRHEVHKVEML